MTAKIKDIGIDVVPPTSECNDPNCPFHGALAVRGQTIDGVVATVTLAECRPLAKTVSFAVIEKKE